VNHHNPQLRRQLMNSTDRPHRPAWFDISTNRVGLVSR
jgi:hypothetical protein